MAAITQNKIRIRLKAYDHSAIEAAAKEIVETAERTGATVSGPVPLPTEKNVYCVIRSPLKDKDSREHLELRHPAPHPGICRQLGVVAADDWQLEQSREQARPPLPNRHCAYAPTDHWR